MKNTFFSFRGGVPTPRLAQLQKSLLVLETAANTDELLKAGGEAALSLIPADDAVMLLYSPSQRNFYLRMTSQGEGTWASPCLWRPEELGAEFKRLLPPQPEPLHRTHLAEKDPLQELSPMRPLGSVLACPLCWGADYWGVLLWGTKSAEGFSEEDQILAALFSAYLACFWLTLSYKSKQEKIMQDAQKAVSSQGERLHELEENKLAWQKERERIVEDYKRMTKTLEESTALATRELVEAYRRLEEESHSQSKRQLQDLVRREVEKAVRAFFDLDLILELILEFCLEELKAQTGSLMLLDQESGTLRIKAAKGLPREVVEQTQLPLGKAIAGFVALEGQPLLIADIENEPRFAKISNERYNTRSLLSVPIKYQEQVLGVININNKRSGEVFLEEDLDTLITLAGQAALVIENAFLYERHGQDQEIKNLYQVYLGNAILNKIALGSRTPELAADAYGVVLLYLDLRCTGSYDEGKESDFMEIIRELMRIIHHHQGRVVKGVGEGVLALFGEPLPQTHDAMRAFNAAKEIVATKARNSGFLDNRQVGLGLHYGSIRRQRLIIDDQEEEALLGEAVKVVTALGQRAPENYFYLTQDYFERIHSEPEVSDLVLQSILVDGISSTIYAVNLKIE